MDEVAVTSMSPPQKLITTLLFILCALATKSEPTHAETVRYTLNIAEATVNLTGQPARALAINGQIPAPTLKAREGDTFEITVNNHLSTETSLHWHGLLLPNEQDGVPHVTTPPIAPGGSHVYRFELRQSGTYWYHSHTHEDLQEQLGLYGGIIIHPHHGEPNTEREHLVILSDWNDEDPQRTLAHLKRDGDYYTFKKNTVPSWDRVIQHDALTPRLSQLWTRMGTMDLSDVGYDRFLINGQVEAQLGAAHPGERIKLRLVNASASSYFYVEFAGGDMEILAADGMPVVPLHTRRLLLATAETYDVRVTVPAHQAYELRATAQDGTGYTSAWLGHGEKIAAPTLPKPNTLLTTMHGNPAQYIAHTTNTSNIGHMVHGAHTSATMELHTTDTGHAAHRHGHQEHSGAPPSTPSITRVEVLEDYAPLRAPEPEPTDDRPVREIRLELTGNMDRYVWSFDDTVMADAPPILIRRGERVRMTLVNKTMMHHPLHLHGHFFRVINGQGAYSPLKHTVDVKPHATQVIEFLADEERDWFFHCHNLYHIATGMARVIRYVPDGVMEENLEETWRAHYTDPWFINGLMAVQSNMFDGHARMAWSRHELRAEIEANYDSDYEIDTLYEYIVTPFWGVFAGVNFNHEPGQPTWQRGVWGVRYILPLLIETEWRIDHTGRLRFEVGSTLNLTRRWQFTWRYNTFDEYHLQLEYRFTPDFSLVADYDSDYGEGVGAQIRF